MPSQNRPATRTPGSWRDPIQLASGSHPPLGLSSSNLAAQPDTTSEAPPFGLRPAPSFAYRLTPGPQAGRKPGEGRRRRTAHYQQARGPERVSLLITREEAGRYAPGQGDQANARPSPNAPSLPAVLDPSTPQAGSALRALTGLRSPGRRHLSGQG